MRFSNLSKILILLSLFISFSSLQAQADQCLDITQLPNFVRDSTVAEWEQIYQEINIQRIDRNLAAFGFSESLGNIAEIIAYQLTSTNANLPIPDAGLNIQNAELPALLDPYRWEGDQLPLVDATRAIHQSSSATVDQIVATLFNVNVTGTVQANAVNLLQDLKYREIGIAVATRPATQEKVTVIVVGSRPSVYPLVINFGARYITSFPVLLSFHNEDYLPEGNATTRVLGRISLMSFQNLSSPSMTENQTYWKRFCNFQPSQTAITNLNIQVTYRDFNNIENTTTTSEWIPGGSPLVQIMIPSPTEEALPIDGLLDPTEELVQPAPTEESVVITEEPIQAVEILNVPSTGQQVFDNKNVPMVYIAGGIYERGYAHGESDEQPVRNIEIDPFYLDVYEVTNARYNECVVNHYCSPTTGLSDDNPVTWVSWNQADVYCRLWRNGRLPTEAEWEFAARYNPNTQLTETRPWGSYGETPDLANYDYDGIDGNDALVAVGSFPFGRNLYGVYDLAGNAFEWVNDWYSSSYYSESPNDNPQGPNASPDDLKVIRGGAYNYTGDYTRSANRDYYSRTTQQPFIGFRCAKNSLP